MTTTPTISNRPPAHPSEDYAFLRAEGLRYLEKVAGLWTDFNSHDPGITLLEVLCYAITDLGYRAGLPVEELLSDGQPDTLRRHFLSAARALPSAPVTELDFRKLLLEIPGVKNAWLFANKQAKYTYLVDCTASQITTAPVPAHHNSKTFDLDGIFDVLIQPDESITEETSPKQRQKKEEALQMAVRRVFHANRNLCEDLDEVRFVPMQDIRVCADIELLPDAFIERVYAEIYYRLQLHFNPPVQRRTLAELLENGGAVEQIFEGPLLQKGFVDDAELLDTGLKREIRLTDLIRVIMDIPGLKLIRKIHMNYAGAVVDADREAEEIWVLPVMPGFLPNLNEDKSRFKFYKGLLPFEVDRDLVFAEYAKIAAAENAQALRIATADKDLLLPEPRFLDASDYTSVQNDLPRAYGVGRYGIPDVPEPERPHRQAQARQLRAYLLFFDQILADYLAQLGHVRAIFEAGPGLGQTYFHQVVQDLKDQEELFSHYDDLESHLKNAAGEHEPGPDGATLFENRKNRLLDHLLGRFCESFNDYVLLMHTLNRRRRTDKDMLREKTVFLQEYEWLSRNRAQAFDFYNDHKTDNSGADRPDEQGKAIPNPLWYDATGMPDAHLVNISGIEHRVARLTGIPNVLRRNLSKIFYNLYEQLDADKKGDLRFRVVDNDRHKILLSSSRRYPTKEEALEELRVTVRLAVIEENYQLLKTADDRFYFNIVDGSQEVVARRIEYFKTEEQRAEAIQYLIKFLTEKYSEEGFFLVEHLLLRPRKVNDPFLPVCTEPNCDTCGDLDPYSHRVHVVLPGYTPRFSDMDFRRFFEDTLRMELPAHLLPKICWIGKQQMSHFETRYQAWLNALRKTTQNGIADKKDHTLRDLIEILNELYTIYPEGHLHDCKDGDETNPIILGQTQLGNLPPEPV